MHIMLDDGKTESPVKILLICSAAVLVPWVWGVWAMPLWVALVSLLFSGIGVYVIYLQIRSLTDNLRARGAAAQGAEQRQASGASDSAAALRDMLGQWLGTSQAATSNLQQVRAMLDEVTTQSESAAASIGNSFRVVMNKTGQQMDDALRLLKSNSDGAGGSTWLSLPDFIKAYEKQLDTVTGRMMDFPRHRRKCRGIRTWCANIRWPLTKCPTNCATWRHASASSLWIPRWRPIAISRPTRAGS